MVFLAVPEADCAALQERLAAQGIMAAVGVTTRLVLHLGVTDDDVPRIVSAFRSYFDRSGV
jgi:threonine aldolase